jgi:hypothetical protein
MMKRRKEAVKNKSFSFCDENNIPPCQRTKAITDLACSAPTFFVIVFVANTLAAHCFLLFKSVYFFNGKKQKSKSCSHRTEQKPTPKKDGGS